MTSLTLSIALSLLLSGSSDRPERLSHGPLVRSQTAQAIIDSSFINSRVTYRTYSNARYGYTVAYPVGILIPQGEADNGDGQIFRSKDGSAEMRVFGSNRLERSLRDEFDAAQESRNVTYKLLKKDMFVVSGTENGKIFYRKTLLRNAVFKTFMIEYDASARAAYDPITARISRSFVG